MLTVKHKGQTLTQEQLDAITPVVNHFGTGGMAWTKGIEGFEQECENAMRLSGCPFILETNKC